MDGAAAAPARCVSCRAVCQMVTVISSAFSPVAWAGSSAATLSCSTTSSTILAATILATTASSDSCCSSRTASTSTVCETGAASVRIEAGLAVETLR
eukprot:5047321-Prymnesium_polylepis.1